MRLRVAQRRRQIVEGELLIRAEHDGPLDGVLQLADVARPIVGEERVERSRSQQADRLVVALRILLHEMVHQRRDVPFAPAQRRHDHGDHVEAVEQLVSEAPRLHLLREVAVGGGDHAHVHLERLGATHPLELALLEYPQQLHLRAGRNLPDFIQEQGAAVRKLEAPFLAPDCPGERATLVPEQLALEQGFGQGGAAHLDEGLVAPR